jgi:peptidylprolyl isomerase
LPEVTDKVYLDVEIEGDSKESGRITLGLFGSVAPMAVENFKSLCACDKGNGKITGVPLCYRNSPIHRVVTDFGIQGGDFSHGDGTGGESIYETRFFKDESFQVQHNRPGLLSMANSGKRDTNGSQFFIGTVSSLWLDGKNIVFGYVLDGMDVVRSIEKRGTYGGRPTAKITIVDSGVLPVEEADRKKVPVPAKSSLSL